jgi:N-acetyl-gamma-glutamyl-phosphate reductase
VREVRGTNLCRINARIDERTGKAFVFAVIDNLWKGAASQAIQNLNLMLGFPEAQGIEL